VQALAIAPIRDSSRTVGLLIVASHHPYRFNTVHFFLGAIADQLGLAIENAQLYTKVRRHIQVRSALHEIAVATHGVLSLQTVIEQGLRALITLFELDAAAIHFVDRHGRLIPLTFQGSATEYWRKFRQNPPHLEETLAGRYALQNRALIIQDLDNFEHDAYPSLSESGMRTIVDVPLVVSGRLIGLVDLGAKRPDALTADDLPLLESLAAQLASSIEAARLHEQTERRVQHLTTLTQFSAAINKTLDLDEILQIVLNEVLPPVTRSDTPKGAIFLLEPSHTPSWTDPSKLQLAAARGLTDALNNGAAHLASATEQSDDLAIVLPHDAFERICASSGIIEFPRLPHTHTRPNQMLLFDQEPFVALPLRVEERLIGVILAAGQPAGSEARHLLSGLADMAAVAIDKAHLHQATQRRLDEITLLHRIALAATSALEFDILISRAVYAIQQTLGFEYVGVLLMDPKGEYLTPHPASISAPASVQTRLRIGQGITGQVAQTRKPIRVPDVSLVENYVAAIDGVQSELCVPLKVGERVIGVIDAESSQRNAFTADDERLLITVAGQLVVIIENARLLQETQRRLREMTTLFNFAQHLSTHLQMESLLDTIVASIRELLDCRGVSIALLDRDNQMLEIKAAAGLKKKWREQARLRIGEGIMGQVAATGEPIYVPDVHAIEGYIFFDQSYHSLLTVPLIVHNRVIGTLSVDHAEPDAFSADDERLVAIAAAQVAVAIENARLFQDLEERAASLAQAYAELKEVDRLKDELVQNVSHELRTPLTFMRGYVDLLLNNDMGPLNPQQRQSLEIVSQKTASITQLVNNIMLLQQLEHRSLQLGLTDIVQVATEILENKQAAAQKQGARLNLKTSSHLPLVLADPERVKLVFQHLVDNAIKFSPGGGDIEIQIREETGCVRVTVTDHGIGIPQDQLDRVFERFYQIDGSLTRRFEGAGLGLNIAKRVIEAHGGQIGVKSRPGQGSTFFFTLPKSQPSDKSTIL
jgi:signal transduction histidine kinase